MYLNLYATPAIIGCILSALIGIYIFYKNTKNIQNRVFALFILFVVVFSIAEVMLRFSSNIGEGLLWGRIGYLGIIFLHMTALHFSFVFPQDGVKFTKNKYLIFGLYLISIALLILFNFIISVQDVQLSRWGYRVAVSSKFYFVAIWCLGIIIFVIFNFFTSYKQSKTLIEKKQVRHVFYGAAILGILAITTNIIPPIFGIEIYPSSTIGLLILSIFIGAAILKYNLFTFKPMIELTSECKKSSPKKYRLRPGNPYLVKDIHGDKGYSIFSDQITHGINGLGVTKYSPQKIRNKYKIKSTPLLQFTFNKSDTETTVNPRKIDIDLIPQIEDFAKKGDKTIFYMDCFDQIALVKGFETSLKLILDIKKICEDHDSIFLLSVNPEFLDRGQFEHLEKELLEVK